MTLVAVYGTLKKGFGNHYLIEGQKFLGIGETPPDYAMLSFGSYPGAIDGDERIQVEVYEVENKALQRMDNLEGHPSFYRRNLTPIIMDNGDIKEAWMYSLCHRVEYNKVQAPLIPVDDKDDKGRITWK
jgi:gamma-glutamylcyclotransferase (GGCT)/AIG2-like uncharacterized protein YtfP